LVPSKKSAADRCRLQSPPDGTPCGSRKTLSVPVCPVQDPEQGKLQREEDAGRLVPERAR
jgi:hypothetical protein